jgi:hypothetical protein
VAYDRINGAFDEPVFQNLPPDTAAFRVYAIGSMTFAHTLVRVVHRPDMTVVIAKRLEADEIENRGRLVWKRTRQLSPNEWQRLLELVDRAKFWELPPRTDDPEVTIFDGTNYVLEGAQGAMHHLVQANSPTGAHEELLTYLLSLGATVQRDGKCSR